MVDGQKPLNNSDALLMFFILSVTIFSTIVLTNLHIEKVAEEIKKSNAELIEKVNK